MISLQYLSPIGYLFKFIKKYVKKSQIQNPHPQIPKSNQVSDLVSFLGYFLKSMTLETK